MPHSKLILLCLLALEYPSAGIAQEQAPAKPRTAAGATTFIQDMLTRGPAEVKPWPGFVRSAKIVTVTVKGNCAVTMALADKSRIQVMLDRVVAIRPLYSTNAPQSSVEIRSGVQPYDGIDIFVGDNDAVRRVTEALSFLRTSCDTTSRTGF